MTTSSRLLFYLTPEHPCSYLPGNSASSMFLDPSIKPSSTLYQRLSDLGFRRSGEHIYRPHCARCNACKSSRIIVSGFTPGRSQRRILQRNRDLREQSMAPAMTTEIYQLYEKYINGRHPDGAMYPPSAEQFNTFLCAQAGANCSFMGYYLQQRLVAVEVVDQLEQGLAAIYTFYDPDLPRRSLGRYAILRQIERAHQLDLLYVYLGFWIRDSAKMAYKTDYQPLELFDGKQWQLYQSPTQE